MDSCSYFLFSANVRQSNAQAAHNARIIEEGEKQQNKWLKQLYFFILNLLSKHLLARICAFENCVCSLLWRALCRKHFLVAHCRELVTPDGLADKGGIRLGDILLEINEEDATELSLTQAHEKIEASGKKIHFLVKNMEEDPDFELGEEKSIVLRVPKMAPPPKEFTPTPLLGTRFWHPIMWHDPPEPPKPKKKKTKTEIDEEGNEVVIELSEDESSDEEEEKELPHHRIVRNIRRFFAEVGDNHELKERTIEDMLLALPTASRSTKSMTQSRVETRGRRNVNASHAKRRGGRKSAKVSDDEDEDEDEYDDDD